MKPSQTWPISRVLAKEERRVGVDLDAMRALADASVRVLLRLSLIRPLSWYRRAASPDAYAVARITADTLEDCGACRQIAVNLAVRDGAHPGIIRAALAGDTDALPDDLAAVAEWTRAVLAREPTAVALGEGLAARLGATARAELALGISVGRVFTTLRRAMGGGEACTLVDVPADVLP